jgi:hypothetical protein
MCSDGLADYFPDPQELGRVLEAKGDDAGVPALIEMAKQRGGADNITIVMFRADVPMPTPVAVGRAAFRAGPSEKTMAAPEEKRRLPAGVRATLPTDRGADSVINRRMIVFAASAMFDGVPATEIGKLLAGAAEVRLAAGQPIPRQVKGVDVAWMIVDGPHKGLLVYPEALVIEQGHWREIFTPPEDMPAVPITRTDFRRYCLASPNSGMIVLQNVGALVAAELRRYLDALTQR